MKKAVKQKACDWCVHSNQIGNVNESKTKTEKYQKKKRKDEKYFLNSIRTELQRERAVWLVTKMIVLPLCVS